MKNLSDTHQEPEIPGHARRLPPLMRRAWYSLNQAFRKRIQHLDITPDQFTLLRWLTEFEAFNQQKREELNEDPEVIGPTQKELAERMSSDPNTIASLVKRMEQARLIKRVPDKMDKRANRVCITAQGQQIFEDARHIALQLQEEALVSLPNKEREKFLASLEKVADECSKLNQNVQ